jgi:hypothetical protein
MPRAESKPPVALGFHRRLSVKVRFDAPDTSSDARVLLPRGVTDLETVPSFVCKRHGERPSGLAMGLRVRVGLNWRFVAAIVQYPPPSADNLAEKGTLWPRQTRERRG